MDTARQTIRTALATAQSPAVLCSFGKDSMLVLALVRELRPDTPVIWFRTGTDERFAKRVIREWGLTAYSPSPADVYLLTDGQEQTIIHEYAFGGARLPVVVDLADGEICSLTRFPRRTPTMVYPFDVVFTGYKDCDTHWLKGDASMFAGNQRLDRAQIITPIRHMTDEQVRAALQDLRIPIETSADELPLCTHCMTAGPGEVYCPERGGFIQASEWEADRSLTAFRDRFQLEGNHG
jgi:3'-phosphoadenosine 5'-phosphosulfate sulfotransferase (PAPS reductase)/FAD synthetase